MIDRDTVLAWRLRRQRLIDPIGDESVYADLFRNLQPVSPAANSYPGSPPALPHRTEFDDAKTADRLRGRRGIVKGRFLGGTIGYVTADDLALYANAFCKPLGKLSVIQSTVYEAVAGAGPLTPRQIKEETGILNKRIMPALHRLQTAFLVYEDQVETDWERGWYLFESEWPEVILDENRKMKDTCEVLRRFLGVHVFATFEQAKAWSSLPARRLTEAFSILERDGTVESAKLEGIGEGRLLTEDRSLSKDTPGRSVFSLDPSDMLVRSHRIELKKRFAGLEALQYLLIDGSFAGAVVGHWRIGRYDVDDIVLELPHLERKERRSEIIAAVEKRFPPERHRILRCDGTPT
jgi:hypothetical protein